MFCRSTLQTTRATFEGRRALAVRDVLCGELHVSTERVKVTALGSAEPEEPNASNAGRAHNRRVEIRVIERRP